MGTLTDDDDDDSVAAVEPVDGTEVELEDDKPVKKKEPLVEVIEAGDDRLSQSDESEDEEDKPHRQRETAAERRARAKTAKERDKKELDFQRRELARQDALIKKLQEGQTVSRVTDLDSRIATAQQEAETYDQIFGKAITAKNGEDARAAAAIRDAAKQRAWEAYQEKQAVIQQHKQQPTAPAYQPLADKFMSENPWYDHSGRDQDSKIVNDIDAQVAKEYIPTSAAYWNELQRRVEKNLPHRFESGNDDDTDTDSQDTRIVTRKKGGPPTGGSSRSNSSTTNGKQIMLSPERVAAMKEAGMWDDPALRSKMAKKYANYDKDNSRG